MLAPARNLTRAEFRHAVFTRDRNRCVVPWCREPAQDAHHILERALWIDPSEKEGYLLDNGVSLCGKHHLDAEACFFPPQACREWAGITNRVLPKALSDDQWYDKWGRPYPNVLREEVKYPSTMYLPFSPSIDVSERGLIPLTELVGKPLVATLKLDGSNCLITRQRVAARNGDVATHPSFDLLKGLHAALRWKLEERLMYFGEWLYAKHSIHYTGPLALDNYLYIHGIYNPDTKLWLGYDDVKAKVIDLGVAMAPEVAQWVFPNHWGIPGAVMLRAEQVISQGHEGLVLRSRYPFHHTEFSKNVAKYVRQGHVQTDKHWSAQPIVKNEVKVG